MSGVRSQCSPSPLTDINITEGLASIDLDVAVPAKIRLVFFPIVSACIVHRLAVARQAAGGVWTVFKFQWQCFIRQLAC